MAQGGGLKMPFFHGDSESFPEQSWDGYEMALRVNRMAVGKSDHSDEVLKGQLLCNLRGKAQRFLECNPELLTKPYDEVRRILKEKYSDAGVHDLMQLHTVVQQPGESVSDFLTRLRKAAKPLLDRRPILDMLERFSHESENWSPDMIRYAQEMGNTVKETMDTFLYHHFMRGLNDKIKAGLGTAQPKDIYEAQNLAERQEKFLGLYVTSVHKGRSLVNNTMVDYDSDTEDWEQEFAKLRVRKEKRKPHLKKSNYRGSAPRHVYHVETKEPQKEKRVTFIEPVVCKEVRPRYEQETARVCFSCGHEGHFASQCFFNGDVYPEKLEFALEHGIRFPKPGSRAHNLITSLGIKFESKQRGTEMFPPQRNFQRGQRPQNFPNTSFQARGPGENFQKGPRQQMSSFQGGRNGQLLPNPTRGPARNSFQSQNPQGQYTTYKPPSVERRPARSQ
jgi:hypothetical protein